MTLLHHLTSHLSQKGTIILNHKLPLEMIYAKLVVSITVNFFWCHQNFGNKKPNSGETVYWWTSRVVLILDADSGLVAKCLLFKTNVFWVLLWVSTDFEDKKNTSQNLWKLFYDIQRSEIKLCLSSWKRQRSWFSTYMDMQVKSVGIKQVRYKSN